MFIAKDEQGRFVDIDKADDKGAYFCPDCGTALIQRRGRIRLHHFAHKTRQDCVAPREPMTEWHLGWQREFPEDCREVCFEADGAKRRADVSIGNLILEFQHSSISEAEYSERTAFYSAMGRDVVWVYDGTEKADNYENVLTWYNNGVISLNLGACGRLIKSGVLRARSWISLTAVDCGAYVLLFFETDDFLELLPLDGAGCFGDMDGDDIAYVVKLSRETFVDVMTEAGGLDKGADAFVVSWILAHRTELHEFYLRTAPREGLKNALWQTKFEFVRAYFGYNDLDIGDITFREYNDLRREIVYGWYNLKYSGVAGYSRSEYVCPLTPSRFGLDVWTCRKCKHCAIVAKYGSGHKGWYEVVCVNPRIGNAASGDDIAGNGRPVIVRIVPSCGHDMKGRGFG